MKRTRPLSALAVLAFTLGALAGCGSEGDNTQVASGGGAQPTTGTSSSPGGAAGLSRDEKAVKFTQCLRENGSTCPIPNRARAR